MWASQQVNERMITRTNMRIWGRQVVENGKYIIARAPDWKNVWHVEACRKLWVRLVTRNGADNCWSSRWNGKTVKVQNHRKIRGQKRRLIPSRPRSRRKVDYQKAISPKSPSNPDNYFLRLPQVARQKGNQPASNIAPKEALMGNLAGQPRFE